MVRVHAQAIDGTLQTVSIMLGKRTDLPVGPMPIIVSIHELRSSVWKLHLQTMHSDAWKALLKCLKKVRYISWNFKHGVLFRIYYIPYVIMAQCNVYATCSDLFSTTVHPVLLSQCTLVHAKGKSNPLASGLRLNVCTWPNPLRQQSPTDRYELLNQFTNCVLLDDLQLL